MRKTLRPVVWRAAFGMIGALAMSMTLRSMIATPDMPDFTYGAGAFNPLVYGGVIAALGMVVLTASYLPARRAATIDPMVAMRSD